jgi:small subunit ribosomal protein S16
MPVKLRLQRKGRTKAPFYHIVVADARAPRDGRFIEKLGTYNPLTVPATIELNRDRAYEWLKNGAQPTDTVRAILRFKGVLLRKHLDRGVTKGALTPEQADAQLAKWIEEKEAGIQKRREATVDAKQKFKVAVDGTAKVKAKPVVVVEAPAEEEAPAEVEETVAAVAEEAAAPVVEAIAEVEAAVEETAPVAEAVVEVEAAPVAEVVAPAPEPEVVAEEGAPVPEEPAAEAEKTDEA